MNRYNTMIDSISKSMSGWVKVRLSKLTWPSEIEMFYHSALGSKSNISWKGKKSHTLLQIASISHGS